MSGTSLVVAVAAGFVSFLAPCVLPLVPGYLSAVSSVEADKLGRPGAARRVVVSSLPFVAGLVAVFVLLGAGAAAVGLSFTRNQFLLQQVSGFVLVLFGLVFTFVGGLRSVIWSDLVQVALYVGAALAVLWFLWTSIPASTGEILRGLTETPDGADKLRLIDLSFDLGRPFSLLATVTGITLLFLASMGLDQDITQRFLACRDVKEGRRALYASVLASVPVVLLFLAIGSLLYVFYDRPDLMGGTAGGGAAREYQGEKITIFMHYILTQIPPGVRGFVAVGVLAAAAVNSGLISMASVLIQDFYRPWVERRRSMPEAHFVLAGRIGMVLLALVLLAMSMLCFYWQRYSEAPLLEFALGVMTFAYSGLLGVYFTILFTRRGSTRSVIAALATGFAAIALQQHYVVDLLGLPAAWKSLAFPFQLCIGTAVAFATCLLGNQRRAVSSQAGGDAVEAVT